MSPDKFRQEHLTQSCQLILQNSRFRQSAPTELLFSKADLIQFFGFSVASALSIYYLQQENKIASSLLVASVEELQQSTGKVSPTYQPRIRQ